MVLCRSRRDTPLWDGYNFGLLALEYEHRYQGLGPVLAFSVAMQVIEPLALIIAWCARSPRVTPKPEPEYGESIS